MRISSIKILILITITIWTIGIINWLSHYQLNQYGIFPREPGALLGIIASPLLHGSFQHLLNNTVSFLILGWLVSLYNKSGHNQLIKLTLFVAFWGGLLTWLLARPSFHIGLSGVIFGYWGFITINGLFEKSFKSILISIIAIFFYGGMAFGVLPSQPNISFEGHFFGALSGIVYSYLYRRKSRN